MLRVLMVEDSVDDAELILQALRDGGFEVDCLRVETAGAMHSALAGGTWDVILSDYNQPRFNGEEALSMLKHTALEIPFIIVSGRIGEETAVALMKAGAHDFATKDNLARLAPAVQRALLDTETRRQFNLAQTALQKSESRFRAIAANLPGVVFQFVLERDGTTVFPYVSDASMALFGLSPLALLDTPALFLALILPGDRASFDQSMTASAANLGTWNWEGRIGTGAQHEIKWISVRASPRRSMSGAVLWDGIMTNITRNKLAEIELMRSRERLAELTSYLQNVKEEERAGIAREIHDDIGGTLTAIKCELIWFASGTAREPKLCQQKAAAIESLVDGVIDSTRRIAMDLRPGVLDCGIVAAVQWQAKEFQNHTAIPCQVWCSHHEIPLDPERSVAVFRILQEALTNISKHAGASRVEIRLAQVKGRVELEITDNGRGITDSDRSRPASFGIRGMRERCSALGGDLQIDGTPGKGTRISTSILVRHAKKKPGAGRAAARIASTVRGPGSGGYLKHAIDAAATPQLGESNDPGFDYR